MRLRAFDHPMLVRSTSCRFWRRRVARRGRHLRGRGDSPPTAASWAGRAPSSA